MEFIQNTSEIRPVDEDAKVAISQIEYPEKVSHLHSADQDAEGNHEVEPPVGRPLCVSLSELITLTGKQLTMSRALSLLSMAFLWTGSQIPVYIFGGIPPLIYGDLGGLDRWIWFVLAYLLALAATCPFVGSIADLIGRRYVALVGSGLLVVAMVICSTAKNMEVFIVGMTFSGVGAGICELTSLAVTSELAPTRKRGKYVAVLIFTIIPFCPSALWGQLISHYGSWRYVGLLCGAWAAIGFLGCLFFYFPPPRPNSRGLTRRQIVAEIDFVGGFLSVAGMVVFLAGLQWGGYQYPWSSAHVLAPLIIGAGMVFVAFPLWEVKFAKYPMFPSRMKQNTRALTLTLVITAISGANFFSVVMFWPTQAFNVYGHDPVGVGIRTMSIGFAILLGACLVLWLLSQLRGHNREMLFVSSVLMTAGCGALAIATVDNLNKLYGILIVAGLGIGGIVVPASIITTIICPDDIIATVSALTLSIRVIGGCIGYTVYYNVFISKFVPNATKYIGDAMSQIGISNKTYVAQAIGITGSSLLPNLRQIPGIGDNNTAYDIVVKAGQLAYAESYKYVYLASIAFGVVSIVASVFLPDIREYMDDHVAVIML